MDSIFAFRQDNVYANAGEDANVYHNDENIYHNEEEIHRNTNEGETPSGDLSESDSENGVTAAEVDISQDQYPHDQNRATETTHSLATATIEIRDAANLHRPQSAKELNADSSSFTFDEGSDIYENEQDSSISSAGQSNILDALKRELFQRFPATGNSNSGVDSPKPKSIAAKREWAEGCSCYSVLFPVKSNF